MASIMPSIVADSKGSPSPVYKFYLRIQIVASSVHRGVKVLPLISPLDGLEILSNVEHLGEKLYISPFDWLSVMRSSAVIGEVSK